jgi:hypothetical protein
LRSSEVLVNVKLNCAYNKKEKKILKNKNGGYNQRWSPFLNTWTTGNKKIKALKIN